VKALTFILFLFPVSCFSLEVLYELENTIPASTYSLIEKEYELVESKVERPKDNTFPQKSIFDAGNQDEMKISSDLVMPAIFVVGFDEFSIEWLKQNANRLKSVKATGFVISANSRDELRTLEDIFEGLLVVTNADELMKMLKISHYPFLLLNNKVYQ
tara:strand:- start:2206 stop:2679 length:474 start_codon:yes stop_codon:yes gene_type:complete